MSATQQAATHSEALKKLVAYWQQLRPEDVDRIGELYAEDAWFQDPFNRVQGHAAISHIFRDMFVRLHAPRFVITETLLDGERALLVWDFHFRIKSLRPSLERRIHGTSLIRFAADGRVQSHRDYWDAAGELYEQLPLVGTLMRALKRRMG
jgi:steroid delta-isomerase